MGRIFLHLLCLLGSLGVGALGRGAPADPWRLRLGFNSAMFIGVNEADARASVRALSATIAHDNGIVADPNPQLFTGSDAIKAAVDGGRVDAIALTTAEFQQIADPKRFDRYLFAVRGDDPSEEYLLLVSRLDHAVRLDELRGKTLALVDGPRLALAMPWLEVTLAEAGLPEETVFFRQISHQLKPSKAILDVYFHKLDACLTTRAAFAAMTELNPQIGTRLQTVAASPPLVPALFAIRTNLDAATKEQIVHVFATIHLTVAGQQALTIFQVNQVSERPMGILQPSFALLDQFAKLRPDLAAVYAARLRQGVALFAPEPR